MVWSKIAELIPSWSLIFQAFMIFGIPFTLLRTRNWARAKEDKMTTRAKKATGSKGGGIPYGELTGGNSPEQQLNMGQAATNSNKEASTGMTFSGNLQEDLQKFKALITDMSDVNVREFSIGSMEIKAAIFLLMVLQTKKGGNEAF